MHAIETIKRMNKEAEKREMKKMAAVAKKFNMIHADYVLGVRAYNNANRKHVVVVE